MNPKGWVKDDADDARWVMTFFNLPYEFAYLILAVDENYEWCAVGGPSSDMLWIMSRTPTLSQDVVDDFDDRRCSGIRCIEANAFRKTGKTYCGFCAVTKE